MLLVHETGGGTSPATRRLLVKLATAIGITNLINNGASFTWSNASSPVAYFSQRLSLAIHDHVACEILRSAKLFGSIVPVRFR